MRRLESKFKISFALFKTYLEEISLDLMIFKPSRWNNWPKWWKTYLQWGPPTPIFWGRRHQIPVFYWKMVTGYSPEFIAPNGHLPEHQRPRIFTPFPIILYVAYGTQPWVGEGATWEKNETTNVSLHPTSCYDIFKMHQAKSILIFTIEFKLSIFL